MPRFEAPQARCEVFTFKEGLLSAVAHDLRLVAKRVVVEIDETTEAITLRVEGRDLQVDCAMKQGQPDRGALSDKQRREIERNIEREVLHLRRHPTIEFRSSSVTGEGDERRIEGTLSLHGARKTIQATARRTADRWEAEVPLHQPDFGITPFSAMFGTLKIQPRVRVRVSIPA